MSDDDSGKYDARKVHKGEPTETGTGFALLSLGLGLNRNQQQTVLRTLWVIAVSGHIAWICGFLTPLGLAAPFARADAVEDLTRTAALTARLQLTQELRVQTLYWCQAKALGQREAVEQTLDRLREEYRRVTKGESAPEFKCP
jgi:hypothetical protein